MASVLFIFAQLHFSTIQSAQQMSTTPSEVSHGSVSGSSKWHEESIDFLVRLRLAAAWAALNMRSTLDKKEHDQETGDATVSASSTHTTMPQVAVALKLSPGVRKFVTVYPLPVLGVFCAGYVHMRPENFRRISSHRGRRTSSPQEGDYCDPTRGANERDNDGKGSGGCCSDYFGKSERQSAKSLSKGESCDTDHEAKLRVERGLKDFLDFEEKCILTFNGCTVNDAKKRQGWSYDCQRGEVKSDGENPVAAIEEKVDFIEVSMKPRNLERAIAAAIENAFRKDNEAATSMLQAIQCNSKIPLIDCRRLSSPPATQNDDTAVTTYAGQKAQGARRSEKSESYSLRMPLVWRSAVLEPVPLMIITRYCTT